MSPTLLHVAGFVLLGAVVPVFIRTVKGGRSRNLRAMGACGCLALLVGAMLTLDEALATSIARTPPPPTADELLSLRVVLIGSLAVLALVAVAFGVVEVASRRRT